MHTTINILRKKGQYYCPNCCPELFSVCEPLCVCSNCHSFDNDAVLTAASSSDTSFQPLTQPQHLTPTMGIDMESKEGSESSSSDASFQSVRLSTVHCSCGSSFSTSDLNLLEAHALENCKDPNQSFSSMSVARRAKVSCPYKLPDGNNCSTQLHNDHKNHLTKKHIVCSVSSSEVHCSCGQFSSNIQEALVTHALQYRALAHPNHSIFLQPVQLVSEVMQFALI